MASHTGPLPITIGPFPDNATNILQGGQNPNLPRFAFNDASLKQRDIVPILLSLELPRRIPLRPVIPAAGPDSTNISITRGSTQVSYAFDSLPLQQGAPTGRLLVDIHVFNTFRNAYTAMTQSLASLSPSDLFLSGRLHHSGVPIYCGHYSIRTPDSVQCMRGNLFIKMTMSGTSRPHEYVIVMVTRMMERLDNYLSRSMVQSSQVRRPSMATDRPFNNTVHEYATFEVSLKDVDTISPDTRVISANWQLLSCTNHGVMTLLSTLQHRFTVWGLPPNTPRKTVGFVLCAAHQDTFHPGWTDYEVTIVPLNNKL